MLSFDIFVFRFYEAAVRELLRSAANSGLFMRLLEAQYLLGTGSMLSIDVFHICCYWTIEIGNFEH